MQVWHGFATVQTVVDHETITGLFQSQFVRDFGGFEQEMAKSLVIFWRRLSDAWDGFLGNDQSVHRGLRRDVFEREHEVVFINNLRWDFASDDFFKQGFAHSIRETNNAKTPRCKGAM